MRLQYPIPLLGCLTYFILINMEKLNWKLFISLFLHVDSFNIEICRKTKKVC